jgi:colicin import membrane protein
VSAAAALPHDALLPRPPGGNGAGALLALLVHAALIAALTVSVNWRSPPAQTVAAELWSAVPQVAAPRAAEPPPAAPLPRPAPVPRAQPAPPPVEREADIALEKARKAAADRERDKREREARAKAEQEKAEREKADREKAARARAEREKAERDKAERDKAEREQAQREKAEREAEEKRLAQQREENLRRMMGQIGSPGSPAGTGSPTARGTAAADAAPSQAYAARLRAAIFPNIVFTEPYTGNPEAVVEVRAAPTGTIISRRIVKPSGNRAWDDAVLDAIDRTATLPRDTDGGVQPVLTIVFRPKG